MENLQPLGFEVRHQSPETCLVGLGRASSYGDLQSLLPAFLNRLLHLRLGIASVFRHWGFIRPELRLRHTYRNITLEGNSLKYLLRRQMGNQRGPSQIQDFEAHWLLQVRRLKPRLLSW